MKIKKGFIVKKVGQTNMVIAVGSACQNFNAMIKLNDSALKVFELLQTETTLQAVADEYARFYQIDQAVALADCQKVVDLFKKAGIIDE